jgi:hypothetical protein
MPDPSHLSISPAGWDRRLRWAHRNAPDLHNAIDGLRRMINLNLAAGADRTGNLASSQSELDSLLADLDQRYQADPDNPDRVEELRRALGEACDMLEAQGLDIAEWRRLAEGR